MDAEPTIVCSASPVYSRMRNVAALSMVLYGIGVPAAFAYILYHNRVAIRADQALRQRGEGELAITNPNLHVRRCVMNGVGRTHTTPPPPSSSSSSSLSPFLLSFSFSTQRLPSIRATRTC
jgi:hypothetical protein